MKDFVSEAAHFRPEVPALMPRGTHPARLLWLFARNPISVWADFQFDVWRHDFRYFKLNATLLNHPDDIHAAFGAHGANLALEPIRQHVVRPLFGDGAISAEGDTWRDSRRISAQALAAVPLPKIASATQAAATRVLSVTPHNLTASSLADELTVEAQSDALFGGLLSAYKAPYLQARDAYLSSAVPHLIWRILRLPLWAPRPGGRAERRNKAMFDRMTAGLSADAHKAPTSALHSMVAAHKAAKLPARMQHDNILTMIVTGQESLARSMAWALFLLSNSPDALARAQAEVDALDPATPPEDWGDALPFLRASFLETMRLFPALPVLSRVARDDISLPSGPVPKGNVVFLNVWILHRHRKLWKAPNHFRPERFLANPAASQPKNGYMPFGTGSRACIGGRVAMMQGIIFLAEILRHFTPEYTAQNDPVPLMRITLNPANGVPLRLVPRS